MSEAADRLELALDPDKRDGWTRLMDADDTEVSEVADLRTVITEAREADKLRKQLVEIRSERLKNHAYTRTLEDQLSEAQATIAKVEAAWWTGAENADSGIVVFTDDVDDAMRAIWDALSAPSSTGGSGNTHSSECLCRTAAEG